MKIHLLKHCFAKLLSRQLTSARLDALGPCVIKLCVAEVSAFLEPRTAGSTTAEFAGFIGTATLATPFVADYGGNPRR